jgi:hypothetical protein
MASNSSCRLTINYTEKFRKKGHLLWEIGIRRKIYQPVEKVRGVGEWNSKSRPHLSSQEYICIKICYIKQIKNS